MTPNVVNGTSVFALPDCISCVVTDNEDGERSLSMRYPFAGANASQIQIGSIITADVSRVETNGKFKVARISLSIDGIFSIDAYSLHYSLAGYPVKPFAESLCSPDEAIGKLWLNALRSPALENFTIGGLESSKKISFGLDEPMSFREALYGNKGIKEMFGGVIVQSYDRKLQWMERSAASKHSAIIYYGRDLRKFSYTRDATARFSHAYAFWADNEGNRVDTDAFSLSGSSSAAFEGATILDLSTYFEAAPTVETLVSTARGVANAQKVGDVEVTAEISFIPASITTEFSALGNLRDVGLYDTIKVVIPDFEISIESQISETVYDCLSGIYKSVTIGKLKGFDAMLRQWLT